MTTLRSELRRWWVSRWFVQVNGLSPRLAEEHVRAMEDSEVRWRMRTYLRKSGVELSAEVKHRVRATPFPPVSAPRDGDGRFSALSPVPGFAPPPCQSQEKRNGEGEAASVKPILVPKFEALEVAFAVAVGFALATFRLV